MSKIGACAVKYYGGKNSGKDCEQPAKYKIVFSDGTELKACQPHASQYKKKVGQTDLLGLSVLRVTNW